MKEPPACCSGRSLFCYSIYQPSEATQGFGFFSLFFLFFFIKRQHVRRSGKQQQQLSNTLTHFPVKHSKKTVSFLKVITYPKRNITGYNRINEIS